MFSRCQQWPSESDLDYADEVARLAEMLHILPFGLGVMIEQSFQLGLQMK